MVASLEKYFYPFDLACICVCVCAYMHVKHAPGMVLSTMPCNPRCSECDSTDVSAGSTHIPTHSCTVLLGTDITPCLYLVSSAHCQLVFLMSYFNFLSEILCTKYGFGELLFFFGRQIYWSFSLCSWDLCPIWRGPPHSKTTNTFTVWMVINKNYRKLKTMIWQKLT